MKTLKNKNSGSFIHIFHKALIRYTDITDIKSKYVAGGSGKDECTILIIR